MAEKVQDKKQKNPQGGKGSEDYRGQKPGEKGPQKDGDQKKGNDKKKW